MTLRNTNHQASCLIANHSSTVVLEDLNVVAMTSSAKGTVDNPSKNVARKAGLNRSINATVWGQLNGMLQLQVPGSAQDPSLLHESGLQQVRSPGQSE